MSKITTIILYVLIGISAIVMFLFYTQGGETLTYGEATDEFYAPHYTGLALNLSLFFLITAVVLAVLTAIYKIVLAPAQSLKSLMGILVLLAVLGIAYVMADTTPMQIVGYDGTDNVPSMLRLADVCLISSWILLVTIMISIVAMSVIKRLR